MIFPSQNCKFYCKNAKNSYLRINFREYLYKTKTTKPQKLMLPFGPPEQEIQK